MASTEPYHLKETKVPGRLLSKTLSPVMQTVSRFLPTRLPRHPLCWPGHKMASVSRHRVLTPQSEGGEGLSPWVSLCRGGGQRHLFFALLQSPPYVLLVHPEAGDLEARHTPHGKGY